MSGSAEDKDDTPDEWYWHNVLYARLNGEPLFNMEMFRTVQEQRAKDDREREDGATPLVCRRIKDYSEVSFELDFENTRLEKIKDLEMKILATKDRKMNLGEMNLEKEELEQMKLNEWKLAEMKPDFRMEIDQKFRENLPHTAHSDSSGVFPVCKKSKETQETEDTLSKQCKNHDNDAKAKERVEKLCENLKAIIAANWKHFQPVSQIIAFGLEMWRGKQQLWLQYHVLTSIAHTIEKLYKEKEGSTKSVPVFAQDLRYCHPECREPLEKKCNIKVLKVFDGFLSTTAETFVVSLPYDQPNSQIIADITSSHGGPLAMLRPFINDDWEHPKQIHPYVEASLDESTQNMVAYKKRCSESSLGDCGWFLSKGNLMDLREAGQHDLWLYIRQEEADSKAS